MKNTYREDTHYRRQLGLDQAFLLDILVFDSRNFVCRPKIFLYAHNMGIYGNFRGFLVKLKRTKYFKECK